MKKILMLTIFALIITGLFVLQSTEAEAKVNEGDYETDQINFRSKVNRLNDLVFPVYKWKWLVFRPVNYFRAPEVTVAERYREPEHATVNRYAEPNHARVNRYAEPNHARVNRYAEPNHAKVNRYAEPTHATVK